MPAESVASLVVLLRQHELLETSRFNMLSNFQGRFKDARALGEELIRLDWLTPYQLDEVIQGRGEALILGPYRILSPLGQGGLSQVFKAWHVPYQCVVALKVLRPEARGDAEAVRKFRQELKVVSQLRHANIVQGVDIDPEHDAYYFALEYVEGMELGKLVEQQGPLPCARACHFIREAAMGLQHAYERGVVHRDIKPANLLVSGDGQTLKILDMGLARREWHREEGAASSAGLVVGTPDFVAPEQATNPELADIRADIYSLGCTLYFMLTGQPPFPGGSLAQKLLAHQKSEPKAIEELRPDVSPRLSAVLRRMMAKSPDDRYRTPSAVSAALAPFARASGYLPALKRDATSGLR